MEGTQRWVGVSAALLMFSVIWFVLVTLNSLPRTTDSSPLIAPTVVTSPEEPGNSPVNCSVATCAP